MLYYILLQGFVPTIMEDVPDMAVKFAVYESLRPIHAQLLGGRKVRHKTEQCMNAMKDLTCVMVVLSAVGFVLAGNQVSRPCTRPATGRRVLPLLFIWALSGCSEALCDAHCSDLTPRLFVFFPKRRQ